MEILGRAELSTTAVQQIIVFVEMDKADHVKFFKQGLEAAKKELSGGDTARESTKTPRPAEERAIIEAAETLAGSEAGVPAKSRAVVLRLESK